MLSIVVPVHNDRAGLQRLAKQLVKVEWPLQLLVVDDASDQECDPSGFDIDWDISGVELSYQRVDTNAGAGAARNLGIEKATGEHLLFLDADDTLATDLAQIMRRLDGLDIESDFAVFKHHRKQSVSDTSTGMLAADEHQWKRLGLRQDYSRRATRDIKFLPNIAAYPWNKIYRTDFIHEHGIRCSETIVHNDIKLHWLSFLLADHVMLSSVSLVNHYVANGADRLTNRPGRDRMCVFDVFADIEEVFDTRPDLMNRYPWFCRFYMRLFGWIERKLNADEVLDFHHAIEAHLRHHLSDTKFGYVNYVDGELARKILKSLNAL